MNDVVHTRAETPINTEGSMDKGGQVLSIEVSTGPSVFCGVVSGGGR